MGRGRMTEEKRRAAVPDKPSGIAPGAVDHPGKDAPADEGNNATQPADERAPRAGVEPSGRPGPHA